MENILIVTGKEELKQLIREALFDSQQTQMKNPVISQDTSDELISRKELSEKLGCSLTTIWKFTKNNKIPVYRMGRKMLFKFTEVREALKDNQTISFNQRGGKHEKS